MKRHHRRSRSNPRRWTMAAIRAANKAAGRYFFDTGRRGYWGGQREVFLGPYEGPVGVFFVSHRAMSSDTPETISLEAFDPATGNVRRMGSLPAPVRLAVEVAKAHTAGRPMKLEAALRALGTREPATTALAWVQTTQRAILDDLRSMVVPVAVGDWATLQEHVRADDYLLGHDYAELDRLGRYADDPEVRSRVLNALIDEVDAWLRAGGHVKALKRLGKGAFRENPLRPARRLRRFP